MGWVSVLAAAKGEAAEVRGGAPKGESYHPDIVAAQHPLSLILQNIQSGFILSNNTILKG